MASMASATVDLIGVRVPVAVRLKMLRERRQGEDAAKHFKLRAGLIVAT